MESGKAAAVNEMLKIISSYKLTMQEFSEVVAIVIKTINPLIKI